MSRNDTRLPKPEHVIKAQQDLASLVGLDSSAHAELVELPSKGLLYPRNHPLYGVDVIEIKHMTGKEEDILANKSYIKHGVAVDKMIQSLLVDKSINVDSMLSGDKTALAIAARITGYGNEYDVKLNCPSCKKVVDFTFDLEKMTHHGGFLQNEVQAEQTEAGTFMLSLNEGKINVEMRLMTVKDERELLTFLLDDEKPDDRSVTDMLKRIIVSINGHSEPQVIDYFVKNAPALVLLEIREEYKKLNPSVSLKQEFECPKCEFKEEIEPPFTLDFLYPNKS